MWNVKIISNLTHLKGSKAVTWNVKIEKQEVLERQRGTRKSYRLRDIENVILKPQNQDGIAVEYQLIRLLDIVKKDIQRVSYYQ